MELLELEIELEHCTQCTTDILGGYLLYLITRFGLSARFGNWLLMIVE